MRVFAIFLTMVLALTGLARDLNGCPLCNPAGLTLSEQLAQADVSVLVQWVESRPPDTDKVFPGATTYEVVEVIGDAARRCNAGDRIVISREKSGQPGDLFILIGAGETDVVWDSPLAVSETSYQYIRQAPSKESPAAERLRYFVRFLEYPDQMVSDDAYSEFASAPYQDIVLIRESLPRDDLRKWVADPNTSKMRLGLYGLLLGLCGDADDAELLREIIVQPTEDLRLGLDGIMGGYVLLAGDGGLSVIDEKLRDTDQPLSEAYSGMQVLRFLWTYAPERVPADRLRASMRTLLERSDMADLAITDLTRWEDWSAVDRLVEMYGQPEFASPHIQKSIIRFCLVAERLKPAMTDGARPPAATKAQAFLAQVAQTDPRALENARRLFFVN